MDPVTILTLANGLVDVAARLFVALRNAPTTDPALRTELDALAVRLEETKRQVAALEIREV